MNNKPNLFLVGAPKSGTTAMDQYLRQHPHVVMAPKESHYFGRDLTLNRRRLALDEYLQKFQGAENARVVGESSVYYLLSETAAEEIHAFHPDARIVIMLRNPADMLYSLHSQRLYGQYEDIADFEAALDAQKDRLAGRRIPAGCFVEEALLYYRVAAYSQQVARYIDTFSPSQVCIIKYEDFAREPARAYAKVLEFLDLPMHQKVAFERINANKRLRSRWAAKALWRLRDSSARKLIPQPARRRVYAVLSRANTKYERRPPLNAQVRARIDEAMSQDVVDLASLTDLDLSDWSASKPRRFGEAHPVQKS